MTSEARAQLADKYRRMASLRASLPADQPPDAAARATLKQLAHEFPGALRELDTLTTDEIAERLRALERGDEAQWMEWMHRYHALMRVALRIRQAGDTALRTGLAVAAGVDDEFVRAVLRPPHGRMMTAVFERLATEAGVERGLVWDTLFPARKGPRPYRRRSEP